MYSHCESSQPQKWVVAGAVAVGALVGVAGVTAFAPSPAATYHLAAPASVATRPVSMTAQAPMSVRAPTALRASTPAHIQQVVLPEEAEVVSTTTTPYELTGTTVGFMGVAAAAVGAVAAKLFPSAEKPESSPLTGRRQFGMGVAAMLPAGAAFAEILPDDDDPELLAAARANRKNRLAQEKALEARTDGRQLGKLDAQCVPIQKAIIALGSIGTKLSSGFIDRLATQEGANISVSELAGALSTLSPDEESKAMGVKLLKDIQSLQSSLNAGDVKNARPAYVSAVASMEAWCAASGVAPYVQGL